MQQRLDFGRRYIYYQIPLHLLEHDMYCFLQRMEKRGFQHLDALEVATLDEVPADELSPFAGSTFVGIGKNLTDYCLAYEGPDGWEILMTTRDALHNDLAQHDLQNPMVVFYRQQDPPRKITTSHNSVGQRVRSRQHRRPRPVAPVFISPLQCPDHK